MGRWSLFIYKKLKIGETAMEYQGGLFKINQLIILFNWFIMTVADSFQNRCTNVLAKTVFLTVLARFTPVSYTHLDVYKRQQQEKLWQLHQPWKLLL